MDPSADMEFTVAPDEAGQRLDRLCAEKHPRLSRNQIQNLNGCGAIEVDGRSRPDSYAVADGEKISIRPSTVEFAGWDPEAKPRPQPEIPVPVVYSDGHIIVVNKPAGLVVHPAHGNPDGTLVNALLGRGLRLARTGGPSRPGVVHRLDKDTSGLMVVAASDRAYHALVENFKDKKVRKQYHAIVAGNLGKRRMTVDAPIGRHPVSRQKMAVLSRGGKEAVSQLFVVDSYSHFDYIRVSTNTGRTHQIRVHLSHVSHPLLGDPVYGGRRRIGHAVGPGTKVTYEKLLKKMDRHALHASLLSFPHPVTGAKMLFRSALPADMRFVLETIYKEDRIKEVQVENNPERSL
jgi:23S rRNA pseudouridine1911/1915/1917 synthase